MKRQKPGIADRRLEDLRSVGPATLADFALLKIRTVDELSRCDAPDLYRRLERLTGKKQDVCVLDTFTAAVAQAKDPFLPKAQANWWYWSRKRKSSPLAQG